MVLPFLSLPLSSKTLPLFPHPVNNPLTLTDVEVDLYLQRGQLVLLGLGSHVHTAVSTQVSLVLTFDQEALQLSGAWYCTCTTLLGLNGQFCCSIEYFFLFWMIAQLMKQSICNYQLSGSKKPLKKSCIM